MNVFEAVKQSVTARQTVEHYGIRVGRNGMACCPFHEDRTPSMKVDRRYHCFGCQADGDVIDFVSRLEGISPKEAALRLAADFPFPMRTGSRRTEAGAAPRYQRNPRSSNSGAWSATVSGYCPTIIIYCADGNGTMPPRPRRTHGPPCLWKPYRTNPMWNICWTCCCFRIRRNVLPLLSNTERK